MQASKNKKVKVQLNFDVCDDCLFEILSFLEHEEVVRLKRVSTQFYRVIINFKKVSTESLKIFNVCDDCLFEILSFLEHGEVVRLKKVSTQFYRVIIKFRKVSTESLKKLEQTNPYLLTQILVIAQKKVPNIENKKFFRENTDCFYCYCYQVRDYEPERFKMRCTRCRNNTCYCSLVKCNTDDCETRFCFVCINKRYLSAQGCRNSIKCVKCGEMCCHKCYQRIFHENLYDTEHRQCRKCFVKAENKIMYESYLKNNKKKKKKKKRRY